MFVEESSKLRNECVLMMVSAIDFFCCAQSTLVPSFSRFLISSWKFRNKFISKWNICFVKEFINLWFFRVNWRQIILFLVHFTGNFPLFPWHSRVFLRFRIDYLEYKCCFRETVHAHSLLILSQWITSIPCWIMLNIITILWIQRHCRVC